MATLKKKMSREGFEKLQAELNYLVTVRRTEVAEKLKEARGFGDLSENAEYDEAKNEQGILESQIIELQKVIENAEIIDGDDISVTEVGVGTIVTIEQIDSGKQQKLSIVGTKEADPFNGKISDESPIGLAALKKKVGEHFIVSAPKGQVEYKVIEISRPE